MRRAASPPLPPPPSRVGVILAVTTHARCGQVFVCRLGRNWAGEGGSDQKAFRLCQCKRAKAAESEWSLSWRGTAEASAGGERYVASCFCSWRATGSHAERMATDRHMRTFVWRPAYVHPSALRSVLCVCTLAMCVHRHVCVLDAIVYFAFMCTILPSCPGCRVPNTELRTSMMLALRMASKLPCG